MREALVPLQESGDGTFTIHQQRQQGRGCAGHSIPPAATLARQPAAAAEDTTTEHVRRKTWGSAASSSGGSGANWQGFPLSRAVPPAAPGNTTATISCAHVPVQALGMVAAVGQGGAALDHSPELLRR